MIDFAARRRGMVETQLLARGITDVRVLEAVRLVPRERFVPEALVEHAYDDCALPIPEGQTISQPYMVALMTQSLRLAGGERVLEVGTGSGYQAAILSRIAAEVFSIERHAALTARARTLCGALGYSNIHFCVTDRDEAIGWEDAAPFDGIVVTAGAARIPETLLRQLRDGARLVIPVGSEEAQEMVVVQRDGATFSRSVGTCCRFVPLIGADGWPAARGGEAVTRGEGTEGEDSSQERKAPAGGFPPGPSH
jgi:protein-L-isoaspartate(D-aspartate) O-methyltransferase